MIEFSVGTIQIRVENYTHLSIREEGVSIDIENKSIKPEQIEESHEKYVLNNDSKQNLYYKKDLETVFGKEVPEYLEQKEEEKGEEKEDAISTEVLTEGAIALRGLVEGWAVGYRQEVDQPDRQKLLFESLEFEGGKVLKYIYHCEGLTKAIIACTELERALARDIAMNICQVSSIIFPPLADTCEMSFNI